MCTGLGQRCPAALTGQRGMIQEDQNAGMMAPLYFSSMNFLVSGERSAFISLAMAGDSALSGRAVTMLA